MPVLAMQLTGCAIVPKPLTDQEHADRVKSDLGTLQRAQEPVSGPISLYEAVARALKYNLDFHVEVMRKALAQRELGLAHYDMLPKFVANLDYSARNNFSGASSRSLLSGRQSLEPSTSSGRDIFSANLGLTWNVLDFGVSYYRAQQAADKVLVQEEEKRKVVNRIVQDVTTAYWWAVAHERLRRDMLDLAGRVTRALERSATIVGRKLSDPLAALAYQRELLSIKQELQQLQRSLTLSRSQLAALMNLTPTQHFEVVVPARGTWERTLRPAIADMEQQALESRPELRILAYQKRSNANEAKAALIALLPGIEFGGSYNYNNNSFLFENDWWSIGSQVAWNLINLARYPSKLEEIDTQKKMLDTERLAMSMAVLTQLHVSLAQYEYARGEYDTAMRYQGTQAQIVKQVRIGTGMGSTSEQALIREEMNTVVAEIRRDIAYAGVANAYAAVKASLGVDPVPVDADTPQSLAQLAERLQTSWARD